jgi:hypothetical protein
MIMPRLLLVIILGGSLLGCSTVPRQETSASVEGAIYSNQEAACLKSDDSARPWELKYALTERTWNEGELFLTVHQRISNPKYPQDDPESTAAIYVKVGDKLKLLTRMISGSDYLKPNVFWFAPVGEDRVQLIQITELFYGTGALTQEHIFTTSSREERAWDLKLEEVEFIPAWESYTFGPGEQIWKGEASTLTGAGLSFEFYVWKDEGKAMRPVGKVTGTYRLERLQNGKLRIIMDQSRREPVTDTAGN